MASEAIGRAFDSRRARQIPRLLTKLHRLAFAVADSSHHRASRRIRVRIDEDAEIILTRQRNSSPATRARER
jgi:hypothetical protein